MAEKLLKEEKLILHCLSLYECLRWEQLIKLINNKPRETAEKIIIGLKKRQYIIEDEAGYVKLNPNTEPDQKNINAFWILLERIRKINPEAHYIANFPSQIYFLQDNNQYEIISLNLNEENLVKMLFLENRNNSDNENDATKYIIIVPNVDSIENCLKNIPESVLDEKRVLFATVEFNYETGYPLIQYYKV